MALTPGSTTSEYRLTLAAIVIGTVAEAVAGILQSLQAQGVAAPWFPTALLVVGLVMQVAALFGYQKARAVVKVAALEAGAFTATLPSSARPTPPATPSAIAAAQPSP